MGWIIIYCCCDCWQIHVCEHRKNRKFRTQCVSLRHKPIFRSMGPSSLNKFPFSILPSRKIPFLLWVLWKQLFLRILHPYLCSNSRQKKQRERSPGAKYIRQFMVRCVQLKVQCVSEIHICRFYTSFGEMSIGSENASLNIYPICFFPSFLYEGKGGESWLTEQWATTQQ